MDWESLLAGGPFAGLLSPSSAGTSAQAPTAPPTAAAPGAPMNILPPAAQDPAAPAQQPGILNGSGVNQGAMQQAMKLLQPQQTQVPAQPQIQMAKPVGSAAGFDPSRILAAMRGQQLPAV